MLNIMFIVLAFNRYALPINPFQEERRFSELSIFHTYWNLLWCNSWEDVCCQNNIMQWLKHRNF